jgi:hypothetical protein
LHGEVLLTSSPSNRHGRPVRKQDMTCQAGRPALMNEAELTRCSSAPGCSATSEHVFTGSFPCHSAAGHVVTVASGCFVSSCAVCLVCLLGVCFVLCACCMLRAVCCVCCVNGVCVCVYVCDVSCAWCLYVLCARCV